MFFLSCNKKEFDNPEDYAGHIEMILVEGGTFQMGKDDFTVFGEDTLHQMHSPSHQVTLNSFKISKYEITASQFCAFLNDIGCSSNGYLNNTLYILIGSSYGSNVTYSDRKFIPEQGKDKHAVYNVTWYGANAYCSWAKGRLPTEAEWEYAAKGGKNTNNYVYSGSNSLNDVCGGYSNDVDVGSKQPNELGIYDMTCSSAEWCNDWYSAYTNTNQLNPQGPNNGDEKILRGQGNMEVFERFSLTPSSTGIGGIRLVRNN